MRTPLVVFRVFGLMVITVFAARAEELYRPEAEIPLGGDGGWDYLAVDAAAHRLYVSHATKVVVIDTARNAVVGEIADTPGVHGIALAPELGRGFVSAGRANEVNVVDLATLKTLLKVGTDENPDAILFEPGRKEVYAFNGRGHSATVFDANSDAVVATIPLGGKPEFAQADPAAGKVFVNVEDQNLVAVIDAATHAVVARWPIAPGEEASGLAIDGAHHRLFAGCANEKMIVLDSTDGRVVASLPAGKGIDAAAFDPGTGLAFVSNGRDGTVTVVREETPEKFAVVQTLATQVSARTMTVDPATHRIYLTAAKLLPPEAGRRWPRVAPGSVKVLVYGLGS
ncbi:MAG TPA: hypothetical protein VG710_12875 [Opitutus sp.]|nr:hypothetical protein [Opitutus sp.]